MYFSVSGHVMGTPHYLAPESILFGEHSCQSDIFAIGDGVTEYAAGHDNGNVYLKNGVTLKDGDTYVLTVDLTKGTQNAVLRSVKK